MLVENTSLRSAKVSMKTTDGAVFSKMAIRLDSSSLNAAEEACILVRRGEEYAAKASKVLRVTESISLCISAGGDDCGYFWKGSDGHTAAVVSSHLVGFATSGCRGTPRRTEVATPSRGVQDDRRARSGPNDAHRGGMMKPRSTKKTSLDDNIVLSIQHHRYFGRCEGSVASLSFLMDVLAASRTRIDGDMMDWIWIIIWDLFDFGCKSTSS
jgi:hypothetical protein